MLPGEEGVTAIAASTNRKERVMGKGPAVSSVADAGSDSTGRASELACQYRKAATKLPA